MNTITTVQGMVFIFFYLKNLNSMRKLERGGARNYVGHYHSRKMIAPASEEAWNSHIGHHNWKEA